MNKMKKFLFLALALAMTSSAFVACNKKGGNNNNGGTSNSSSEITSSESSSEITSSESSSESDSSSESGDVDNTPKANVKVATPDELAAFNAEGVKIYNLDNFQTTGETVSMETAYVFSVTESVDSAKAGEYANWIADYYVSVDTAVTAGNIGLAGSYESWDNGAWVAFYSPIDLAANQEIGLLASTGGTPWTYADVVEFVGTFRCGAFDLNDACKGVTLKVELRLTNPDDASDKISVCVTEYVFA